MKAKDYLAVNYVFFPPLFEYYRLLYKKKRHLQKLRICVVRLEHTKLQKPHKLGFSKGAQIIFCLAP